MAKFVLLAVSVVAAAAPASETSYAAAVMSDNPTAYFQLRDPPAAAVQTNEVTNRHLQRVGTFVPRSFSRTELEFSPSAKHYFMTAPHSDFSPPSRVDFSLEIFTYAFSKGSEAYRTPVANRQFSGGPYAGYTLYITPSNGYELWYASGDWCVVEGGPAFLDQWVHLAFSHDASLNTGYFFVNGVLKAVMRHALIPRTTAEPLYVGAGNSGMGPDFAWDGSLSDLATFHACIPGTTWRSRSDISPLMPSAPLALDAAATALHGAVVSNCTAADF